MKRFLFTVQEVYNKISKDNLASYAAQTCFYILMSIVPTLVLLLVILKQIHISVEFATSLIGSSLPPKLSALLLDIVQDISNDTSTTVTGITIITIAWSAGKSFMAIINGLDVIYDTNSKRNWVVNRLLSVVYTISILLAFAAAMILVVFGNSIFRIANKYMPQFTRIISAILSNRVTFICCFLIVIFLFMYRMIPNRKSSLIRELPGAILSTIGWYGFSVIFSLYVEYSPNFSVMYGSLTSLIFAMMMLYFCMFIFFLGAELNVCIQSGIIQLRRRSRMKKMKKVK